MIAPGRWEGVFVLVSVFAHILVPLIALVAVAVIQFDKRIPMPEQIAEDGPLHPGDWGHRKHVHQSQAAGEVWAGVDGAAQHRNCAGHGDSRGAVHSCEALRDGAAQAGKGQLLFGGGCDSVGLLDRDLGSYVVMEALKMLAIAVGFALAFASGITVLVSLAMDPLERMRQRWVERGRDAVKAVRV